MADPKHPKHSEYAEHPEHFEDPASIPILTDVLVPGRSPTPPQSEAQAHAARQRAQESHEPHEPHSPLRPAELTERDAEHIAERLRARVAGYLREDGRRVIEARCREALEEHTAWLVRQVTREVVLALEGEVAGWVRDAVREELAVHQSTRR